MAAFASQQPIDGLADTSYYQEELDRIRKRGNSVVQNSPQGLSGEDNFIGDFLDFYNRQKSPIYDGLGNQIGFNHGYGVEERWDPQQPGDDKWISDEEWEQLRNEPSPPPDQRWPNLPGEDVDVPQPIGERPGLIKPVEPPDNIDPVSPRSGYGSRVGADPDSNFTMDWVDKDGDGVDDRHQRGPGQPFVTWEDSTPEERGKGGRPPGGRDTRIGPPPGGWPDDRGGRKPPRWRGDDQFGPGDPRPPVQPGLPRPPEDEIRPYPIPGPRPKPPGPRPPRPRPPEPRPPIPGPEPRPPIPGPRPPRPDVPPPWEGCPTPDQQILLADKSLIFAGELQVGDKVHTMHETTFESGDYEVTHVSFHEQPVYLVKFSDDHEIRCSASHKLYSEDKEDWVSIKELGSGERVSLYDGEVAFISAEYTGDEKVVKITVEDAHTYICEGLFSHNKTLIPEPPIGDTPPIHGDPGPKLPKDEAAIAGMYQDYLGRDADEEGFQYWLDQVRSGNQSLDQVAANIKASPESEDYRASRPTPVPSGVGDEDYRAVSIRYADGYEPSEEEHRVNQKRFWEEAREPLTRFGEKRNEERGRLESSVPSRPTERKEEAKERSRQWQQDRGPIRREERAPKPNIGRDPERRPRIEPSKPKPPDKPKPDKPKHKKHDWLEAAYQENLGRAADRGGRDYWANEVASGRQTKEQVVENIRRSDEYQNRTGGVGDVIRGRAGIR